jgi:putative glycoprotease GCP
MYIEEANKKLKNFGESPILAIETSCDETAAAVTRGRQVISSVISSQIEIHRRFGGVVPEIASRNHILSIDAVVREALEKAGATLKDISAVAVTYGGGLLGALLVGVSYAKALAYALNIPLIAVNHIKGHIAANYISAPLLSPPFICLLASGGHTAVLKVNAFNDIITLGETKDDAAGEAFDKVARVLGLPYPGGPEIENLAKNGKPIYRLPKAEIRDTLDFSFSGLKTAVINLVSNMKARGENIDYPSLAASFQETAVNTLVEHAIEGAKLSGIKIITLAGGVAANFSLRERLEKTAKKLGISVFLPPRGLATDNAAMIGVAAYEEIMCGAGAASLDLDAEPEI